MVGSAVWWRCLLLVEGRVMKRGTVLSAVAVVVAVLLVAVLLADLGGRSPRGRAVADQPKAATDPLLADPVRRPLEAQEAAEKDHVRKANAPRIDAELAKVAVEREQLGAQLKAAEFMLQMRESAVAKQEKELAAAKEQLKANREEVDKLSDALARAAKREAVLRGQLQEGKPAEQPEVSKVPATADKLDRILDRLDKLEKQMTGLEEALKRKPQ
jgi:ABC-type transporter Mla subunit MlaD